MSADRARSPTFRITHPTEAAESLVVGLSNFGLAGLTAADYLADHLELEVVGHLSVENLPTITPFEDGTPRHHTRLFSRPDLDVTILVGELFVPVWAADPFADALLEWTDASGVQEVSVLTGVPVPHGPDDHQVFYVASEDYQEHVLREVDIPPMGNGFLDGVNASLIGRGIDSPLRVGVFVTPVHAQVPDAEAALRLVDAFERVHGIEVDTGPLEGFAAEVEQHYRELAARLQDVDEAERPEDRMYM